MRYIFTLVNNIDTDTIDLHIRRGPDVLSREILTDAGWVTPVEGAVRSPIARIDAQVDTSCLQSLANALYDLGIQPRVARGVDSQVAAINKHLEDMRALVFKESKPK